MKRIYLLAFVAVLSSFCLYLYTLPPTICWGDTAKLAVLVHEHKFVFTSGGGHGLYTFLGWLFTNIIKYGDLGYNLNIFSAFLSCISLFFFSLIVFELTDSILSSVTAALTLAVSHMFWFVSVITESYSLLALTFTIQLYLTIRWIKRPNPVKIYLLWIIMIIGVLNHMLNFLFVPITMFFIYYLSQDKKKDIFALFFMPVLIVLLLLVFNAGRDALTELKDTIWLHLTRFSYYQKFFIESLLYPAYLAYQFPIGIIIGIYGLGISFKERGKWFFILLSMLLVNVSFAGIYGKSRQLYVLIPSFIVFAIFVGIGLSYIEKKLSRKLLYFTSCLLVFIPVLVYYFTPRILTALQMYPVNQRVITYRNSNSYFLWPSKRGYTGAYKFAKEALSQVKEEGLLLADWTLAMPVEYLQKVKGYRGDVKIFKTEYISYLPPEVIWEKLQGVIDKYLSEKKKVYLADDDSVDFFTSEKKHFSCWHLLNEYYKVTPKNLIYEISAKNKQIIP